MGELLEAFGPQDGPNLKKARKCDFADPPQGARGAAKIEPKRHLDDFWGAKKEVQKRYLQKYRKSTISESSPTLWIELPLQRELDSHISSKSLIRDKNGSKMTSKMVPKIVQNLT